MTWATDMIITGEAAAPALGAMPTLGARLLGVAAGAIGVRSGSRCPGR